MKEKPSSESRTLDFAGWKRIALKGLFFPPDRRRVRRELEDHYEDCVAAQKSRGLSAEAAKQAALKAMGDPRQTGALLRAVHKPWLGWTLRLARIALVLVLLILLWSWMKSRENVLTGVQQLFVPEVSFSLEEDRQIAARRTGRLPEAVKLGQYEMEISDADQVLVGRVLKYREKQHLEIESRQLRILLRFPGPPWAKPDIAELGARLRLVDDQGRVYHRTDDFDESGFSLWKGDDYSWVLYLSNRPETEWIDLIYDYAGLRGSARIQFGPWYRYSLEGIERWGNGETALADITAYGPRLSAGRDGIPCLGSRELRAEQTPSSEGFRVLQARLNRYRESSGQESLWLECWVMLRSAGWDQQFQPAEDSVYSYRVIAGGEELTAAMDRFTFSTYPEAGIRLLRALCQGEADSYQLEFNGPDGAVSVSFTPGEEVEP